MQTSRPLLHAPAFAHVHFQDQRSWTDVAAHDRKQVPRPLRTIAAMAQPFTRLPSVPELPALEQEILEFWQRERVFDRLREQNAEGPRFSFFDGPVTAFCSRSRSNTRSRCQNKRKEKSGHR